MDPNRQLIEESVAFMGSLNRVIQEDLYGVPQITTITVGIKLEHGLDHIELDKVTQAITNPPQDIKNFMDQVLGGPLHRDVSKRNFNNSVIIKMPKTQDRKQQAIKVFCNGSLHITGFKHVKDAIEVGDVFTTLMELIHGGRGIDGMFKMVSFDVQLINACFKHPSVTANHVINLEAFYQQLRKHINYYSTFNTDRYAGVIIKAPDFNVLVFESGSIILTSIKTPDQLKEAFVFIDGFLCKYHREFVERKTHSTTVPKPAFNYSDYLVLK